MGEYRYSRRILNNEWKDISGWNMQWKSVNETELCSEMSCTQQKFQSFINTLITYNKWPVRSLNVL
jgi:hypothetical protein